MVPLPGSATRMSPAEMGAAKLGLTNIGERLNVSVKSAAHTIRKQTRMEHLPMVERLPAVRMPDIRAAPNYSETLPLLFARSSTSARADQDHVDVATVARFECIGVAVLRTRRPTFSNARV